MHKGRQNDWIFLFHLMQVEQSFYLWLSIQRKLGNRFSVRDFFERYFMLICRLLLKIRIYSFAHSFLLLR